MESGQAAMCSELGVYINQLGWEVASTHLFLDQGEPGDPAGNSEDLPGVAEVGTNTPVQRGLGCHGDTGHSVLGAELCGRGFSAYFLHQPTGTLCLPVGLPWATSE